MNRFVVFLAMLSVAMADAATFKVGFSQRDITPQAPTPMWGYGARHDLLSEGTDDPLFAKAIVIDTGGAKLALVGLDLGRAPTLKTMDGIRKSIRETSGIEHVLISGSHTHHGPVIELLDEPGKGQGKFDDAVAYVGYLEKQLSDAINEAATKTVDAKMGWASIETDLNRNRHKKEEPKPRDPELAVLRFDDLEGKPIVLMVNFAAHATIQSVMIRKFTSEWPGHMQRYVEEDLGAHCFFMQGAAGDLSPNTNDSRKGIDGFGRAVADRVIELAKSVETAVPATPSVQGMDESFTFNTRVNLHDPVVQGMFKNAFFPELLAMLDEMPDQTIHPQLATVLVNKELALVGGSGEFFCEHANRLKRDSAAKETFFVGYCNGHHMYFPTLEAIDQGGYGADATVSWVEPGAGEKMIDKALSNITVMLSE